MSLSGHSERFISQLVWYLSSPLQCCDGIECYYLTSTPLVKGLHHTPRFPQEESLINRWASGKRRGVLSLQWVPTAPKWWHHTFRRWISVIVGPHFLVDFQFNTPHILSQPVLTSQVLALLVRFVKHLLCMRHNAKCWVQQGKFVL